MNSQPSLPLPPSPTLLSSKRGKWVSSCLQPLINLQRTVGNLVLSRFLKTVPGLHRKGHSDQLPTSAISTGRQSGAPGPILG